METVVQIATCVYSIVPPFGWRCWSAEGSQQQEAEHWALEGDFAEESRFQPQCVSHWAPPGNGQQMYQCCSAGDRVPQAHRTRGCLKCKGGNVSCFLMAHCHIQTPGRHWLDWSSHWSPSWCTCVPLTHHVFVHLCLCEWGSASPTLHLIHHQPPNTGCTSITAYTLLFEPSKTKSRKKTQIFTEQANIWVFDYIALILDICYQCIMTSCVCHALCFSEI